MSDTNTDNDSGDRADDRADATSFGRRAVSPAEKARLVRGVFERVADRYDLMNDLMSLGVHRLWKSVLVDRLHPRAGRALLDMAGGTGDVARAYLDRAGVAGTTAVVCDVNEAMLRAGARRVDDAYGSSLHFVAGDAMRAPAPDRFFDAYSISFGIRNVADLDAALWEAFRVLKPGGRFACLEFSEPIVGPLRAAYDAYSYNVIPWLGEQVVGDRESYDYLVESIRRFPRQDAFAARIERAGFAQVRYENLSGGVAALHLGWRL